MPYHRAAAWSGKWTEINIWKIEELQNEGKRSYAQPGLLLELRRQTRARGVSSAATNVANLSKPFSSYLQAGVEKHRDQAH